MTENQGPSVATQLVALAKLEQVQFFRDQDRGTPFATIQVGAHHEHLPVRGRAFKEWLSGKFFAQTARAVSAQALQDAVSVLSAEALFTGTQHALHVRVAGTDDGRTIFLDLADAGWRAIKITAEKWTIEANPPVYFRRSRGMRPLPDPMAGGTLDALRHFVRVPPELWPLILGWLVMAARPRGPYPVLVFVGEQGSAKSTAQRLLRALIDPNAAPLRALSRDVRDVAITAHNSWVLAYDNISRLEPWISDAFCRLSTGGGFSTRELFENDEEVLFTHQRPLMLNGIDAGVNRSDLLDRSLLIELARIPEDRKITETALDEAFLFARPMFLGALLDALVIALRRLPTINLPRTPRMADFATWATAAEPGLGLTPGTFMDAYTANRREAHDVALESALLAVPVRELMGEVTSWEGQPRELLETLTRRVPDRIRLAREWPNTPRGLTSQLKRIAPNLAAVGINVAWSRVPGGTRTRLITLTRSEGS